MDQVRALPLVASRTLTVIVQLSLELREDKLVIVRVGRLGHLSTVAMAIIAHRQLVNLHCTRRCSKMLVPRLTVMLMMMLLVPLLVPEQIIQSHFVLRFQGKVVLSLSLL